MHIDDDVITEELQDRINDQPPTACAHYPDPHLKISPRRSLAEIGPVKIVKPLSSPRRVSVK
jgi:hypothetical protein